MESNYYLEFENKFRGEREKILDLLQIYEPLIEKAIAVNTSPLLIDIGCGRGECLQKYKNKFCDSFGIESDPSMVRICRDHGLNVLQGDALEILAEFESDSISVITIFHVVEHLEHQKLLKLLNQCYRVLNNNGILIIETPSIDNIIVSTKSFYLDHTHINPINSEAICFHINKAGFSDVKYFFLNGGPLKDASSLKITRILNGVAQDLCIIATKDNSQFQNLFIDNIEWQSYLNEGLTTLESAIEFDLKLESYIDEINTLKQDISLLKKEINLLKSRLKYFILFLEKIKFYIRPIFYMIRFFKKILLIMISQTLNLLVDNQYIRNLLFSRKAIKIFNFCLLQFNYTSVNSLRLKLKNKLKIINEKNKKFDNYNQNLFFHYKYSMSSKKYKKLISKAK